MRLNPFRPGSIVNPGMFAGRGAELLTLDQALTQTKFGNPQHLLIHGERGIGKSSLLNTVTKVATGKYSPLENDDESFQFLTLPICLEPTTTLQGLVGKIGREMTRRVRNIEGVKTKLGDAWDFLKRWEAFGVKYNPAEEAGNDDPIEDLAQDLAATHERMAEDIDGVFLSIDEADQGAASCQLGEFIKVFTERLEVAGCHNVLIVVSGISNVIAALRDSHPSSVRIFTTLLLETLSSAERLEVIRLGMDYANSQNSEPVSITAEAAEWIAMASEGYPHFIQQYAYSAFETNMDEIIDRDDVIIGAHKEHGAIDQLGSKYFEDMYIDKINSDDYRTVLQVMAESQEEYLTRATIKEKSGLKETTLTNALGALSKRQIIVKHREKNGLYKLPSTSFGTWIRARTLKTKAPSNGSNGERA